MATQTTGMPAQVTAKRLVVVMPFYAMISHQTSWATKAVMTGIGRQAMVVMTNAAKRSVGIIESMLVKPVTMAMTAMMMAAPVVASSQPVEMALFVGILMSRIPSLKPVTTAMKLSRMVASMTAQKPGVVMVSSG
jgi:hypothetical protein